MMDTIKLTIEVPADLAGLLSEIIESVRYLSDKRDERICKNTKKERIVVDDEAVTGGEDSAVGDVAEAIVYPTLEEVESYCKSEGLIINPERFFNHYSKNNWITQRGKVVDDWKSLAKRWDEQDRQKSPRGKLEESYDMMRGWAAK